MSLTCILVLNPCKKKKKGFHLLWTWKHSFCGKFALFTTTAPPLWDVIYEIQEAPLSHVAAAPCLQQCFNVGFNSGSWAGGERDLNVAVLLAGIWRGQTVKTLFGAVKRCSPVQSTKIIQTWPHKYMILAAVQPFTSSPHTMYAPHCEDALVSVFGGLKGPMKGIRQVEPTADWTAVKFLNLYVNKPFV